ncbi:MAG: hypothetical protein B7X69_08845 [Sulfurovum sp. 39-42-12]|nr:MAG: hypothetical protein B7Y63_04930 [Sulfurovum sp. 35-42-20]OYZ25402.1 MAG: hypothetical protein B7Y23_05695 [Sulfurovum sp. 16-42-52]OYZ49870.1 MAG: hypothetical protein B7Y13_03150 [Sulfurovum sp. 24-42-9]OZA45498.1 MAG: hypothetical protein B7X80_05005 [Sulfurovum sp. 17-42-90]OZA59229.1 MAG: hypothetical protein B7X69_08845 [Sulfurovum sp. 39-42-12]
MHSTRKGMRQRLEMMMQKAGRFITKNPIGVIVVTLLLLAFPLSQLPQLKITSGSGILVYDNSPLMEQYQTFAEEFGRDERIIIGLKSDTIFTLDFLKMLRDMHEDLESNLPYLAEINSLYNARYTRGEGEKLLTENLLAHFPQTQQQIEVIKKRAMESHFYKDLFLSADGKMTAILLETDAFSQASEANTSEHPSLEHNQTKSSKTFLSDAQNAAFIEALKQIVGKYKQEGLEIYIAGSPLLTEAFTSQMHIEMLGSMCLFLAVSLLALFVLLRRVSAVVIVLVVSILSVFATVGTMAWMGVCLVDLMQIVPFVIVVSGMGASVHLLTSFFETFNTTGNKQDAVIGALIQSGSTIVFLVLITALVMALFAYSDLASLAELGMYTALGVLVTLFLTLTLLPALLSIIPLKPKVPLHADRWHRLITKISLIPVKYYKTIIITSVLVMIVSALAAMKLGISDDPLTWFSSSANERVSTQEVDAALHGSVSIELIVDTKKENGWSDLQRLENLNLFTQDLENYVDGDTRIGKVVSLATIIKETNRALHQNQEKFYVIPGDAQSVAQALLLFESSGSDDLQDVVDSQFSKTRITLKLPLTDVTGMMKVLRYIKKQAAKTFPDDESITTGMLPLLITTVSRAVDAAVWSFMNVFMGMAIAMMFLLGTLRLGLSAMIPMGAPFLVTLFMMYILGLSLDMVTLFVAFIAIVVSLETTIHFMYTFKRYYKETQESIKAMEQTFHTVAQAMVTVGVALSLGFYALMFSEQSSVAHFGLLSGSIILLALFTSLLLSPAWMIFVSKRGWIR